MNEGLADRKAQAEQNATPEVQRDGDEFAVIDPIGLIVVFSDVATEAIRGR